MNTKIYYSYHSDPKNPYRIITIARQLSEDGTVVRAGMAVCAPLKAPDGRGRGRRLRPGDQHNKKLGRKIATGRMQDNKTAVSLALREGEHPLVAVLNFYATAPKLPAFVARTCEEELYTLSVDMRSPTFAPMGAVLSVGRFRAQTSVQEDEEPVRTGSLAV